MLEHMHGKYGWAFVEMLFIRLRSENIRSLNRVGRMLLYLLAFAVFYAPILYFSVKECLADGELVVYFFIILTLHVVAKFMLCISKKIQHRFSMIKKSKHFLIRTWLIIEYVAFMWLVYLLYPLTCIFIPFALLSMSVESVLGYSFIIDLLVSHSEQFLLYGGIISYIIFIIADGYKKLRAGFLPDYLGLYAVLTVISASITGAGQKLLEYFSIDISRISATVSRIIAISNESMSIVASAVTLFFAIYSLYTNCGTGESEEEMEEHREKHEHMDSAEHGELREYTVQPEHNEDVKYEKELQYKD